MNDTEKDHGMWDLPENFGFAQIPTDQPVRGTRANDIIADEFQEHDPEKLRVAARRYAKTKQVDIESAYKLMRNNPVLLEQWAIL